MTKDNILHILFSVLYGGLFLFLVINIVFSQQIAPLLMPFMSQDTPSVVRFLKQAKEIPDFRILYPEITHLFDSHKNEVFQDELQRKELIGKLEVMLQQNPQSRDVLYSLYLLHEKNGDVAKAQQYLQQAKNIDPGVGR
ncbi:MAG TPA: hypothetical protein PLS49_02260 [Candidatus Woesebacteria bacterium]|nr:hypothetical protein [Candidatus Woesebacteria bacterium]